MRELRVAESIPAYLTTMVVRRAGRLKARMARAAPLPEDEPADPRPAAPEESMQQRTYLPWLEECVGALTVRSRSVLRLQFGQI